MKTIIIPTLNAAANWDRFSSALLACATPDEILIVDSSSTDETVTLARAAGFRVYCIPRAEFNHGATRQFAAEKLADTEFLVYMTQDAILKSHTTIDKLLGAFEDPHVAAAYGRQLAESGAGPIEAHARNFNYPALSDVRDWASRGRLGFKAIFISNSFAAYRRSALLAVGGFPHNIILGEDTFVAAKLLKAKWKIAYVSESQAFHSHAYTCTQEFRRYFDIGILHGREQWLLNEFGQVGNEGRRFVDSELKYLWRHNAILIPSAIARTGLKLLGYKLGRRETLLSQSWKRRLSMHKNFWDH